MSTTQRYEGVEIDGCWVIQHKASGAICESFTRKCSAMKRLNHSYS